MRYKRCRPAICCLCGRIAEPHPRAARPCGAGRGEGNSDAILGTYTSVSRAEFDHSGEEELMKALWVNNCKNIDYNYDAIYLLIPTLTLIDVLGRHR